MPGPFSPSRLLKNASCPAKLILLTGALFFPGTNLFPFEINTFSVRWVGLQAPLVPGVLPGFSGGLALGGALGHGLTLSLEYRATSSRQGTNEWLPSSWASLKAGNDEATAFALAALALLYPLTCNLHQGWAGLSIDYDPGASDGDPSPVLRGGLGLCWNAWWPWGGGTTWWQLGPGLLVEAGLSFGRPNFRHRLTASSILTPAHQAIQTGFSKSPSWAMGFEITWSTQGIL